MKLSEMLLDTLLSNDYNPVSDFRRYMCVSLRIHYGDMPDEVKLLRVYIANAIAPHGTLSNYLFFERGIQRETAEAHYDFYLDLAAKLELEGL